MAAGLSLLLVVFSAAYALAGKEGSADQRPVAEEILPLSLEKEDIQSLFEKGVPHVSGEEDGSLIAHLNYGLKLTYTLDPVLQRSIEKIFRKYQVRYGCFVAIRPSDGRVLALVDYGKKSLDPKNASLKATYPAASIFKVITAAAAIDRGRAERTTKVRYRGDMYRLTRSSIRDSRYDRKVMSIEDAFAKSSNVVFGKVALKWVGRANLATYARAFGFNRDFHLELPLQASHADVPAGRYELARTGAGFGNVTISPLHAAMLAAAVANDGRMPEPYIVERIIDREGRTLYAPKPRIIARPISPRTAGEIRRMMAKTISIGTSHSVFRSFRKKFRDVEVGGKTGTLSGKDPRGRYNWFVGFAPTDEPEIAIAALVVNGKRWRIKGTHVGKAGFETYFKTHH